MFGNHVMMKSPIYNFNTAWALKEPFSAGVEFAELRFTCFIQICLTSTQFFFICTKLREKSDPELDPDPLVRGTDPRIRIRTKNSRIPTLLSRLCLKTYCQNYPVVVKTVGFKKHCSFVFNMRKFVI